MNSTGNWSEFLVSILQTAHLWANTGVVFRELSFSRLECGVHDIFYCLIRKRERFTISNVESQVFTPRIILA